MAERITSPKLHGPEWYRYYAGYSSKFAADALALLDVPAGGIVLDPWNGSGTSTSVARSMGYGAIGYDLNPALVVVGRGRLLSPDLASGLTAIATDLTAHAAHDALPSRHPEEPLEAWLGPATSLLVRRLEAAILSVLVPDNDSPAAYPRDVTGMNALAAFFYVALFEVVRSLVADAVATNPTWVGARHGRRKRRSSQTLTALFLTAVDRLAQGLPRHDPGRGHISAVIDEGSSTALPLQDDSIDAVLTSPPYGTRIDYVVATLPELAVLGYTREAIRHLRDNMIGTPTINRAAKLESDHTPAATSFLHAVAAHPSKASATYYLTFYRQYMDGISTSISEITRVARQQCKLAIVVQDSYYKDIRLNLALMTEELLKARGWVLTTRLDFRHRARSSINPRATVYGAPPYRTESVLIAEFTNP